MSDFTENWGIFNSPTSSSAFFRAAMLDAVPHEEFVPSEEVEPVAITFSRKNRTGYLKASSGLAVAGSRPWFSATA